MGLEITDRQAAILQMIIKISGIQDILEIGTYHGFSARAMADALLATNGQITTIEKDEGNFHKAQQLSSDYSNINFIHGLGLDVMEKLYEEGKRYDMIFIDANKSPYKDYFIMATKLLKDKENCLIIADNVLFRGYVMDESNNYPAEFTKIVKGIRAFLDLVKNHNDFETIIIEQDDGFSVSRKIR